MEFMYLLY